jgi:hypothetical protein
LDLGQNKGIQIQSMAQMLRSKAKPMDKTNSYSIKNLRSTNGKKTVKVRMIVAVG